MAYQKQRILHATPIPSPPQTPTIQLLLMPLLRTKVQRWMIQKMAKKQYQTNSQPPANDIPLIIIVRIG